MAVNTLAGACIYVTGVLQIVFAVLPVDTVVDIQNGFHLSLSKQILLKDSSDEASVSVKGHLFAEVFISWGSALLDVTHLVFVILSKIASSLYTSQFLEDLIFISFVCIRYAF